MYYGLGIFAAGQKGEPQYAHCKWVKKECKEFYLCLTVNKFGTSQICPVQFKAIWYQEAHWWWQYKKVRGLK